jgi:hypothetical protein
VSASTAPCIATVVTSLTFFDMEKTFYCAAKAAFRA